MFVLSFNVAPYFQLKKTCFFKLISEHFPTSVQIRLTVHEKFKWNLHINFGTLIPYTKGCPLLSTLLFTLKTICTFKKASNKTAPYFSSRF